MSSRRVAAAVVMLLAAPAWAVGQAATSADSAGWADDLRLLAREVERIHPQPWAHVTRHEFASAVEVLVAALPKLTDNQRVVRLMQTVSLLRDGHTRVTPTVTGQVYVVFPIRMFEFSEGIFVTVVAREYRDLVGAEVLRIGNRPAADAWRAVASLVRGDNEIYATAWAAEYLPFGHLLQGLGIIEREVALPLDVRLKDGSLRHVELAAVPWDFRDSWFWWPLAGPAASDTNLYVHGFEDRPSLPLFVNRQNRRYWFELLPQHRAAYLYFQSFADLPDEPFSAFQDRMFHAMDEQGLSTLVIDLRWNAGGNGNLIWPLIYNIIKRDRLNATGHVYVITGRHSFSASVLAVAELRRHAHAITVGEPMAAAFNACGDPTTITLPHSGHTVSVSELYWQRGFPADRRVIVAPDVVVPLTAANYFAGRDAALERILDGSALNLEQTFQRLGPEAGTRAYRQVLAMYPDLSGWEPWPERDIHDVGRNLRQGGYLPAAIAAYTLNAEAHPESWNAWDDLGVAYYRAGDREQARRCFEKSLILNPGNANARDMLGRIP